MVGDSGAFWRGNDDDDAKARRACVKCCRIIVRRRLCAGTSYKAGHSSIGAPGLVASFVYRDPKVGISAESMSPGKRCWSQRTALVNNLPIQCLYLAVAGRGRSGTDPAIRQRIGRQKTRGA